MTASRPRPLRVVFVNWRDQHHPEGGGSEKYLDEVAKGLARRGHRVTIRTAHYPGALPYEVVDGVHYVRKGGAYSVYLRALMAQALTGSAGDVVVDVQNGMPFLSPLVRRGAVVNLVHHVHREQWPVVFNPRVARFGWWMESKVAPRVYRRSPYVAVSPTTKRELTELMVDADRIHIVCNGTDAVRDEGVLRSQTPVVTVLGRLVPQKRVEIAMRSVAALLPDHPDLVLRVVGSGWWEPQLRQEAERLGIADHVRFSGHVSEDEKHQILAQSWVLTVPSLKEGWGLVVVEAGIHGTPAVAFTEAGGLNDSIRDGETGFVVAGGQAEYTAALRRLLEDDEVRTRMSRAAIDWVTQFTWDETVRQFEAVLEQAVPDRAGAAVPDVAPATRGSA